MTSTARIVDATLREGMQTIAGTFSTAQSVEIATMLAESGAVHTIECGHPMVSEVERERVTAVAEALGEVPLLTHARLRREDIEAAAETGASWVGVFVGVNEVSERSRTGWPDLASALVRTREAVAIANELGLKVRFTVEDATRTRWEQIEAVLDVAVDAGASRLCLADSLGIAEPTQVSALFTRARMQWPGMDLEGHFHDDRGLAMANSLAATDAGATFISTSINSLGERAGIPDLAAFVVNQHLRSGSALPPPGALQELSRRVGAYSRSAPDGRRPIVGRDAFRHASKLHERAVAIDASAYEMIAPESLGRNREVGTLCVSRRLSDLVVDPPVISATELRHHRHGPGERYVLVDDRFVPGSGQYCIARRFPPGSHPDQGHVDPHVHHCDSLFGFLGDGPDFTGLTVEVELGGETRTLRSPASVFIPAGELHSYRAVEGAGTYLNYVLAGSYNESLLDPIESITQSRVLIKEYS